ncbi:MAG: aminoacyl-histidine dipeptidase [Prevotella sp.]|nr:aminoacyl-histidine dipeptidase [Prevotella sp.]
MDTKQLSPKAVFEQFARINQIPRPSKHEEKMIEYLVAFGRERGLETLKDEVGNVLIRKKAAPGYEDKPCITLQSHIDMVCDKLVDRQFDFNTDPIETYIDGDWMKARGTTLGADDGIGCAIELALLDADNIEHGPLECLFTRDEETGLTGAEGLKANFITGNRLINLDSEDEGQIFVSCAGGRTTTATFRYQKEQPQGNEFFIALQTKGLFGGHSGDDINKKRANAVKLMARFLYEESEKTDLRLASWHSGRMHNAIPRDGKAVIAVPAEMKETVRADWNRFAATVEDEFHITEQTPEFLLESAAPEPLLPKTTSVNIIRALQALDNGVYAMCQDKELDWLVETSSNLASIQTSDCEATVTASQRSCVMSCLDNICNTIKATFLLAGAEVKQGDGYPAWKMNPDSGLTKIAVETYRELFGKDPLVLGIHAGLECGLFSERYPELDMISIGPTLRNVHTPEEMLYIPTVQMVWDHLLAILKS